MAEHPHGQKVGQTRKHANRYKSANIQGSIYQRKLLSFGRSYKKSKTVLMMILQQNIYFHFIALLIVYPGSCCQLWTSTQNVIFCPVERYSQTITWLSNTLANFETVQQNLPTIMPISINRHQKYHTGSSNDFHTKMQLFNKADVQKYEQQREGKVCVIIYYYSIQKTLYAQ